MLLTFAQKKTNPSFGLEEDDFIKKIEFSKNYSNSYSNTHTPEHDISQNKLRSVVYKESENTLEQTVIYHFWKMDCNKIDYYFIAVSKRNKDLISIEDKNGANIPLKFFKVTDENEIDIIIYDSPRL